MEDIRNSKPRCPQFKHIELLDLPSKKFKLDFSPKKPKAHGKRKPRK
jgi:hypothetical protein